jgi:hypothetical protein
MDPPPPRGETRRTPIGNLVNRIFGSSERRSDCSDTYSTNELPTNNEPNTNQFDQLSHPTAVTPHSMNAPPTNFNSANSLRELLIRHDERSVYTAPVTNNLLPLDPSSVHSLGLQSLRRQLYEAEKVYQEQILIQITTDKDEFYDSMPESIPVVVVPSTSICSIDPSDAIVGPIRHTSVASFQVSKSEDDISEFTREEPIVIDAPSPQHRPPPSPLFSQGRTVRADVGNKLMTFYPSVDGFDHPYLRGYDGEDESKKQDNKFPYWVVVQGWEPGIFSRRGAWARTADFQMNAKTSTNPKGIGGCMKKFNDYHEACVFLGGNPDTEVNPSPPTFPPPPPREACFNIPQLKLGGEFWMEV